MKMNGDWSTRVMGWVRDLGNGREIHLVLQLYNVRVSTGQSGADGWQYSW